MDIYYISTKPLHVSLILLASSGKKLRLKYKGVTCYKDKNILQILGNKHQRKHIQSQIQIYRARIITSL